MGKNLAFKDPPSLKFHNRTDIICYTISIFFSDETNNNESIEATEANDSMNIEVIDNSQENESGKCFFILIIINNN